jgi:tRNA threonylcarbamoyladenosine biosynthesis protein TsaE
MMKEFTTHSPEETEKYAGELARSLARGTVLLLFGGLGAGKTAFTRGFARGLGITEPVSSPTFTIVQEYVIPSGGMLYHMDLYRIDDPDSALAFGIDEFLEDQNAFCVIEWPERGEGLYPPGKTIRIDVIRDEKEPETRTFQIKNPAF